MGLDPQVYERLLERLAEGELLSDICKSKDMPCRQAIYQKMRVDKEFEAAFAIAKELQCDMWADEIVRLADLSTGSGKEVHSFRLRVDARKWVMSKILPKKYGDRITQEVVGEQGVVTPVINVSYSGNQPTATPETGDGA